MKTIYTTIVITLLTVLNNGTTIYAQNNSSSKARQIFNHTYEMVYGPQGCRLHYDVNILRLYHTNGTIWMKGKKQRFFESRYHSWSDDKTYYLIDTKKQTLDIFDINDPNKDKYSSKFKFVPDDYYYAYEETATDYILILKPKEGVKGFKEAKATIDKKTRAPKDLRIKVAFLWAKIAISDFKSGNISEDTFIFPESRYKDYQTTDHRKTRK